MPWSFLLAALWIGAARDGGTITVRASGLAPGRAYVVSVDVATPHASVACMNEWSRRAVADSHGRLGVRLSPKGPCGFGFDRDGWVAFVDGPSVALRSSTFR